MKKKSWFMPHTQSTHEELSEDVGIVHDGYPLTFTHASDLISMRLSELMEGSALPVLLYYYLFN